MKTKPYCSATLSSITPLLHYSILLAFAASLSAAPPPELITVQQQYEKAVIGPHVAEKAALDSKFIAALTNAATAAKQAGHLDEVLAIRAEQKRLTEKLPIPDDDAGIPDALKKLRGIYREQLIKIEAQRTANHTALLPDYTGKLKDLEIHLTRSDRIEDAMEVKAYRESLVAGTPPALPVAGTDAPSVPATASKMANTTKTTGSKGDDLKAAEWVLGVGGSIGVSGGSTPIASVADLPHGRFFISAIRLPSPMPPVPDAAFDTLSELRELEKVDGPGGGPQTDEAFRFLRTCPKLRHIDMQNWTKMDGRWLGYLSDLEHLEKLWLTSSAKANLSGLGSLRSEKLIWLEMRGTGATDENLAVVGGLKNLKKLGLRGNPITDAGLASLAKLTRLETLDLLETSVTSESLRTLAALPLTNLGFGLSPTDFLTATPELGRAFPKMTGLMLPPGTWTKGDLNGIGVVWPKILRIEFPSGSRYDEDTFDQLQDALPGLEAMHLRKTPVTDRNLAALASLKKLKVLDVSMTSISDGAIPSLQSMRSLKYLDLSQTKVSETGFAEFKKQRPDVDAKK